MHCPACKNATLVMADRHGIEIDYCPQCRGVWLDRGELDKIIDRAAVETIPRPQVQGAPPSYPNQGYPQQHPGGYYKKKKREGFFGELFDFD